MSIDLHYSSLDYLKCVKCHAALDLTSYYTDEQINEGILVCTKCGLVFPIIQGIAILWNDFASYISHRQRLGGQMLLAAKSPKIKSLVKSALSQAAKSQDLSIIEKRWTGIYQKNQKSRFYGVVKHTLHNADLALEHGCSIGVMTKHLAQKSRQAFGIDKSFYAILVAKKSKQKNLDFFVADSMEHPFGKTKFDLILGLNLFELIEPKKLLKVLASQMQKRGILILSDPYDYDRGEKSVKEPLHEDAIRKEIAKLGFVISAKTKKPSHISWNLNLHKRANLQYLVDLLVATKS